MNIIRLLSGFMADLTGVRTCPVCDRELLDGEEAICIGCLSTLPRTATQHMSGRYADIFANAVAPQGLTEAWFDYDPESPYAQIIRRAKYYDSPRLARTLGRAFGRELTHRYGTLPVDVLLPVPMHCIKRMRRSYNQSEEIAGGISETTGIPVGDNLTTLHRHSTQTRKNNEARRANIKGTVGVDAPEELQGLRIAIVDDIVTTGATIAECVAALSLSGARPQTIGFITLGATYQRR